MDVPKIKLNNGAEIPAIGYGTWQLKPDDALKQVEYAIKEAGYRHIDCAFGYQNESFVGEAIRNSGVPRSELFITSKVWGTWHRKVEECLDKTLEALGTDYLDLYLMHWPIPMNPNGNHPLIPLLPNGKRDVDRAWDIKDTWKQIEAVLKKGKVRTIGVSNFSIKALEGFLPYVEITPAVNQLELHPYNPDHALVAYCESKGIVVQAYSPLGSNNSPLISDETVIKVAEKYPFTAADVLLGWHVAKGRVVIARSITPARISSNIKGAAAAAAALSKEDIAALDGIAAAGKQKRMVTPPWPVDLGFENWPPL